MNHTQYNDLVEKGRALVERSSAATWELADLIANNFPAGKHGINTGAREDLAKFADDIGISPSRALSLRTTAEAWPEEFRRRNSSFSAHEELNKLPNRFELIEDHNTKAKARRKRQAETGAPDKSFKEQVSSTVEGKARQLAEILEGDDADEVMSLVPESVRTTGAKKALQANGADQKARAELTGDDQRSTIADDLSTEAPADLDPSERRPNGFGQLMGLSIAADNLREAAVEFKRTADASDLTDELNRDIVQTTMLEVTFQLSEFMANEEGVR